MIILDFETNSTNPKDVLEVGAYKILKDNNRYKIIDTFHRYYFSKYEINFFALDVHNLSPERITKLRENKTYTKHFEDDIDFIDFCKNAETIIAHNISFEIRYLDNIVKFKNHFCTMKENKMIVNALNIKGNIKNPKLIETCKYYDIEFDDMQYHSALYDAKKALEILNSMNNPMNNFDIVSHTIKKRKEIEDEKKLEQTNKMQKELTKKLNTEKKKIEREKEFKDIKCHKCSSKNIHKKGKRQRKHSQVQRYQCMDCNSIFQKELNDKSNLSSYIETEDKTIKKLVEKNKITSDDTNNIYHENSNKNKIFKKIFNFLNIHKRLYPE